MNLDTYGLATLSVMYHTITLVLGNCPPGSTAFQVILHPICVSEPLRPSVLNKMSTMLVLLLIATGRVMPQFFSIKVVPSPSTMVRWSQTQSPSVGFEHSSMSNAVNWRIKMSPSSTWSLCFFSRLGG